MENPITQLLLAFGCNLSSSAIYDFIKSRSKSKISKVDFIKELAKVLECKDNVELASRIYSLLSSQEIIHTNEISGEVNINLKKAKDVIGISISSPTRIMPGTKINIAVDEAENVTGLLIK